MSGIEVEPAVADEPGERHPGLRREVHRQARRRRHRGDDRDRGRERLLDDLEARTAAHEQDRRRRTWIGAEAPADHLVDRVVASDVLTRREEIARGVDERGAVETAGRLKDGLRRGEPRGQGGDRRRFDRRARRDGRAVPQDGFDRARAAEPAAGRRERVVAGEPFGELGDGPVDPHVDHVGEVRLLGMTPEDEARDLVRSAAITPSLASMPSTRSVSAPGVRMVTSQRQPFRWISSGSSTASASRVARRAGRPGRDTPHLRRDGRLGRCLAGDGGTRHREDDSNATFDVTTEDRARRYRSSARRAPERQRGGELRWRVDAPEAHAGGIERLEHRRRDATGARLVGEHVQPALAAGDQRVQPRRQRPSIERDQRLRATVPDRHHDIDRGAALGREARDHARAYERRVASESERPRGRDDVEPAGERGQRPRTRMIVVHDRRRRSARERWEVLPWSRDEDDLVGPRARLLDDAREQRRSIEIEPRFRSTHTRRASADQNDRRKVVV